MAMSVLLLNASYDPLRIITLKRAVILVMQDKAEIVEEGNGEVRSQKVRLRRPSVIRLKYYVNVPFRTKMPLNNRNVLIRDKYECAYCNDRRATTVDHVVPRAKGGRHEWTNVVAACARCNSKKSDKMLSEIGWETKWVPRVPSGHYWLVMGAQPQEKWEPYLRVAHV